MAEVRRGQPGRPGPRPAEGDHGAPSTHPRRRGAGVPRTPQTAITARDRRLPRVVDVAYGETCCGRRPVGQTSSTNRGSGDRTDGHARPPAASHLLPAEPPASRQAATPPQAPPTRGPTEVHVHQPHTPSGRNTDRADRPATRPPEGAPSGSDTDRSRPLTQLMPRGSRQRPPCWVGMVSDDVCDSGE